MISNRTDIMNRTRSVVAAAAAAAGALVLIADPAGAAQASDPTHYVQRAHRSGPRRLGGRLQLERRRRRLQHQGYTVKVPPNTLRGVATDSENLKAYLSTINGPIVLVGHSYGGMVISNAATGNNNVKSLYTSTPTSPAPVRRSDSSRAPKKDRH